MDTRTTVIDHDGLARKMRAISMKNERVGTKQTGYLELSDGCHQLSKDRFFWIPTVSFEGLMVLVWRLVFRHENAEALTSRS